MDERFRISYLESDRLIDRLYFMTDSLGFWDPSSIIRATEKLIGCKIKVLSTSFTEQKINPTYGAMMSTSLKKGKPKTACIILNTDINDDFFRRFSLLHEIGHLFTTDWQGMENVGDKDFIVSTHINYKLIDISEDEYDHDEYMLNEQRANIFALRVLMPGSLFYPKIFSGEDFGALSSYFHVKKDAVISRLELEV